MKEYLFVCAACNQQIGSGTADQAEAATLDHAPNCTATEEEHEKALIDMQFRSITQGLSL